ncbi:MAG TPA: heme lyase CcmF/NrfE family subunit [Actinomycetota bacterium]|nr:heme lyase CcmF/NrfE family subunit [Actinomycetota bacterium]
MLGRGLILVACGFAAYASVAAPASMRRLDGRWTVARPELLDSARRAVVAVAASFTLASLLLWWALFTRDFSIAYVAEVSSRATQPWYTFSAFWSSMDGSLLLWCWMLALYAAIFAGARRPATEPFLGWGIPVVGVTILTFGLVTALASNPFTPSEVVPADGRGLNPLLQSPGMVIHPPLLYLGFTGLSVPLAIAVAALVTRCTGAEWLRVARTWVLTPWLFLGAGMVLGGAWAYTELGWGGYWAWDPVENAALLPWLAATAFLHSSVVQERRGMLRVWNIFLVLAAADLAVFGTFLTRSGLLSSVHTFAESPIGRWFFLFLAAQTLVGFGLLVWRLPHLRTEHHLDSPVSRESAFLVNNLLFVGATVVILWGTILPLITEALTGERLAVGPPFFNRIMAPLGCLLLILAAIGPVVPWRRGSLRAIANRLKGPAAVASGVTLPLGVALRSVAFAAVVWVAVLLAAASLAEIARGVRTRRATGAPSPVRSAFRTSPRRYGGYLVHLGIAVMTVGFAGNVFHSQTEVAAFPGDRFTFAGFEFQHRELQRSVVPDKDVNLAVLDVSRGGRRLATLRPQLNMHPNFDQPQSEIAIRTTPLSDLYVILAGTRADDDGGTPCTLSRATECGRVVYRIHLNPLVFWVWAGAAMSVIGSVVALVAGRRRPPAPQRPRIPAPAQEATPAWTS